MQSQTKMLQFTKKYIKIGNRPFGEMSEWSNVPAWKASIPQGIGGSNPLLSATENRPFGAVFSWRREEIKKPCKARFGLFVKALS